MYNPKVSEINKNKYKLHDTIKVMNKEINLITLNISQTNSDLKAVQE